MSYMKALFCSLTHTKTYHKKFTYIGRFYRVVGPHNTLKQAHKGLKSQKMTSHWGKRTNSSKARFGASILFPYPYQNIFQGIQLHRQILQGHRAPQQPKIGPFRPKITKIDQNRKKIQKIAQKFEMKALIGSCTHIKTYFKEFSFKDRFFGVVGPQNTLEQTRLGPKSQKMTITGKKSEKCSNVLHEGSILFPYAHQNISQEIYQHQQILQGRRTS